MLTWCCRLCFARAPMLVPLARPCSFPCSSREPALSRFPPALALASLVSLPSSPRSFHPCRARYELVALFLSPLQLPSSHSSFCALRPRSPHAGVLIVFLPPFSAIPSRAPCQPALVAFHLAPPARSPIRAVAPAALRRFGSAQYAILCSLCLLLLTGNATASSGRHASRVVRHS